MIERAPFVDQLAVGAEVLVLLDGDPGSLLRVAGVGTLVLEALDLDGGLDLAALRTHLYERVGDPTGGDRGLHDPVRAAVDELISAGLLIER